MEALLSPAVIRSARWRQRRRRAAVAAAVAIGIGALLATRPWGGGGNTGPTGSSLGQSLSRSLVRESRLVGSWSVFGVVGHGTFDVKPGRPGRVCFSYAAPGKAANGCGPAPTARNALSSPLVVDDIAPQHGLILGLTTPGVERVELVLRGGRTVSAHTRLTPLSVTPRHGIYALDVKLPGRPPRSTLVAYGSGGKVVGRREL